MKYTDLLSFLLGRDSGWRFTRGFTSTFNFEVLDSLVINSSSTGVRNPQGMNLGCTIRKVGVGVPARLESEGLDQVQSIVPGLKNKILTGPLGRSRVTTSDINGIYASLSLGISTDEDQNLTMIWFGDFAGIISTALTPTGYPAFLSQLALATAVGIVPSGSSGINLSRGYFSVNS